MENKGLYYPANATEALQCDLTFFNGQIHVYCDPQQGGLRILNLKNALSCEWKHGTVEVHTASEKIVCSGEIALQINAAWNGVVAELPSHKKKLSSSHLFFFCIVLAMIGLCFWLYFGVLPWVAEKAVGLVPVDYEITLGEKLSAAYTNDNKSDSATYFAKEFTKALRLDDTYPIDVTVLHSEELNAFALPGGKIFIYSGLLEKMDSHEQLVALLGHEVTHVTERHSLKSMSRGAASAILISMMFGDMSSWLISKADEFKQLNYSRELETEADQNGLRIMIENKVDPKGMLALLQVLKEANAEEPGLMKYLSTHPDTDSRIENISSNPEVKTEFTKNEKMETIFLKLKRCI